MEYFLLLILIIVTTITIFSVSSVKSEVRGLRAQIETVRQIVTPHAAQPARQPVAPVQQQVLQQAVAPVRQPVAPGVPLPPYPGPRTMPVPISEPEAMVVQQVQPGGQGPTPYPEVPAPTESFAGPASTSVPITPLGPSLLPPQFSPANSMPPAAPAQPVPPVPPAAPTQPPTRTFQMNENFLGRNLLPIIAAILGLAGLIYLGILVVPHLTDPVKIILMFGISLGIGGLGYYLNRKHTSVLTNALMGTGVGGVFISILVTNLYFHALPDLTAFALLTAWIVVSMWLAHHVNSLLIAILAHAGMVASITTAYLMGFADDKLVLLLVYQLLATLAIILGNVFWTRALYRFGLFASQVMIIVCISAMWHRFMGTGVGFASSLPPGLIVAAFIIQFLGATAIAYLLFVSCARVKDAVVMGVLGVVNSGMWLAVVVEAVTVLVAKLSAQAAGLDSDQIWVDIATVPLSLVISLIVCFLPSAAIALAGQRVGIKQTLEYATVVPLVLVSTGMLLINMNLNGQTIACPWLSALAAAYLALGVRSRVCSRIGQVALIVDAAIMLIPSVGYDSLTDNWSVWVSLAYLVVLLGLGVAGWAQMGSSIRTKYGNKVLVGVFLVVEFSLIRILTGCDLRYREGLFVLITMLILAGIHFLRPQSIPVFYRIAELATISVAANCLYNAANTPDIVLASCATIGLIVILADRIREAARTTSLALRKGTPQPDTRIEVLSGIGLTVAAVGLFTPYDWFLTRSSWWPWGFPTSLACMVVALIIVGLGLWSRVKPLRLYGLVVVIIAVLKLVTLDLGSVNSITRVVAFLGGAAVCFGISALYNYTAKHFDKELAVDGTTTTSSH